MADPGSSSEATSREVEKHGPESDPIRNQNQNAANEALAVLVAALIAKGDVAAAARMLAAFETPRTPGEPSPERPANVTDIASRRGR